ncbi:MAG: PQQ-dependent sugar dehydrogenase [Pseudomonadales bacterium]|jgi:glucose/arabinose dehydrogenase|nr:PQQ-dependent sugar dehydrogenase [Pseudomonadales bacterium]
MRLTSFLLTLAISTGSLSAQASYSLETVAENLNFPWSIAFTPEGDYLVAMRSGVVRRISAGGEVSPALEGLPASYVLSQGGYFDITLDPGFTDNQRIYLSFAYGTPELNGTRIVTGRLNGNRVENVTPIFTVSPLKDTAVHYGGKMLFLPDGTLVMTTGDGFEYREAAQDTFNLMGKIIRINSDGSIPADNPYASNGLGNAAVWSYGHRNPQGLVLDKMSGHLYSHEHGAKGGDELNLIKPDTNYGWPAVTKGVNYSGAYVSPLRSAPGIEEPLTYWDPSIGASGLAIYDGDAFPNWRGKLFIGALVDEEVRMLTLSDGRVVDEQAMFSEIGARIRDVRTGPDGMLYLLTDSEQGKMIRVVPVSDPANQANLSAAMTTEQGQEP